MKISGCEKLMRCINRCLSHNDIFDKYRYRSILSDIPYEDRVIIRNFPTDNLLKLNNKIFDHFNNKIETKERGNLSLEEIYINFNKYCNISKKLLYKVHLEKIYGSDEFQNMKEMEQEFKATIWESLCYGKMDTDSLEGYVRTSLKNRIGDLMRKNSNFKHKGYFMAIDIEKIGEDIDGSVIIEKGDNFEVL